MMGPDSGRSDLALILTPLGRDSAIAAAILQEAKVPTLICRDVPDLCREIERGVAVVVVAEEALHDLELNELARLIGDQPPWSDLPFVVLALRGAGLERNPAAGRLSQVLGNVSFLERPFHPTTLVSVVKTALRGRRRQYEARERIDEIRLAEALLERRVAERTAELEAANRQLATQIAERERAEQALNQSQRLEAVGQLTSGVAHDFNNLLTVVLGNAHQLQKTAAEPVVARRLDMITQAAERGARLTAHMLAFSRRQKLEPRVVDLNETVGRMHDLLQSTIGGSIDISTSLQDDLWPAMIDPTKIELAILNLGINARDAMGGGGALTMATANVTLGPPRRAEEPPPGEYVMVSVRDTGPGMSAEVLAKAFEPFFTTKEVGKGSGLGLSQVFGLAKQSGGGVRIENEPGRGVAVNVYLPRADPDQHAAPRRSPAEVERVDPDAVVLVVDDDEAVRQITAGMLRDLGYGVMEAGSGGAALDAVDNVPDIDIVLLDFAMPGMNGAEVAREIAFRRPELPIVFATGYADTAVLTEIGDDCIVYKPFMEDELAEKLARCLARYASDGRDVAVGA